MSPVEYFVFFFSTRSGQCAVVTWRLAHRLNESQLFNKNFYFRHSVHL